MARNEAAADFVSAVSLASKTEAAGERSCVQTEAWLAWLLAASVAVFLTSNPFYLATACLVGLVVYSSLPRSERSRAYGLILKLGLFFALLSIPFNVLTGSSGATPLLTLPRLAFPDWLGGVVLGGDVTAEALVYAACRVALRLIALLLFAVSFNLSVDHYRLLRLMPLALRQLGVVVTVAVLLIPQTFAQARAVAEAQRLRGRRLKGVGSVMAVAVPLLAGALERAVQRAESLDARGFGAAQSPSGSTPWAAKLLVPASAVLVICGAFAYFYYPDDRPIALAAIVLGLAAGLAALWRQGRGVPVTRYQHEPLGRLSLYVAGCSLLAMALLVALRLAGVGDVGYYPYPEVTAPAFHPVGVLAILLLLAPVVPTLLARSEREATDD